MNKKLLFAAMSLAAFTACTDNDFESQKVAEKASAIQFEVLNTNDDFTFCIQLFACIALIKLNKS